MFLQFEALYPQVRVYFRHEGLHVEIFSARDVIPLDPNGDCQVSSLYLIFVFVYTTAEGKGLDTSSPTHPPTICLQPF